MHSCCPMRLIRNKEIALKYVWISLVCIGLVGCGDATQDAATTREPPPPPHPGQDTYNKFCFSCHAAGVAGAPKTGDAVAWAPRVAKGDAQLLKSTVEGISPGMPPMGLCMQCTEAQLAAAIDFMIPD
jgi:cytochrome c5